MVPGMRHVGGVRESIEFDTWDYRPPYLPQGTAILMGKNSHRPSEPLLFVLPWKSGPGYECPVHVNRARRVTKVSLTITDSGEQSPEFGDYCALRLVDVSLGATSMLEIELDGGRAGGVADLRPDVPLVVRW